jgi:AraC-like DNA-binding protein
MSYTSKEEIVLEHILLSPPAKHGDESVELRPKDERATEVRLERIAKALVRVWEEFNKGDDDLEKLKLQTDIILLLRNLGFHMTEARCFTTAVVKEMYTYKDLSEHLGMSRGRVQQLATDVHKTKRASQFEVRAKELAAAQRAHGSNDAELAATVLPELMQLKQARTFSSERVADILGIPEKHVQPAWDEFQSSITHDLELV